MTPTPSQEYSEIIMMVTEGLDNVSSEEVRQERRALVNQLQSLLAECDKAKLRVDNLMAAFVKEDRLGQILQHAGNILRTVWSQRNLLLFSIISSGALKMTEEHGGVAETAYLARDKLLDVWDVLSARIKKAQEALFPLPKKHQAKKRMTDRSVQSPSVPALLF